MNTVIPYRLYDIMGNLIPQNINVWMGCHMNNKKEGIYCSSTGLHHDYHDNLYILYQGIKIFTIISPEFYDCMYNVEEKDAKENNQIIFIWQNG